MISGFKGIIRTDDDARAVYSESAGIARTLPRGVAVPANAEDVVALVQWARTTQTPLIPRGSGSSMSGGAVGDGYIVDLSQLHAIGSVDITHKQIHVDPGAIRNDIDTVARRAGLYFPPDPSSSAFCTIGGMIATNAAGAHTLKYGATRPWITSLDCVFDDGSRATITRDTPLPHHIPAITRFLAVAETLRAHGMSITHAGVRKDASGYALHDYARTGELIDLLVGSEGTLAIIVGATLRLTDVPTATSSVLGTFATLEDAVTAAGRARDAGAAACELLDRTFLDVARQGGALPHVPEDSEAVLLADTEGTTPENASETAHTIAHIFASANATSVTLALTPDAEHELWTLRHAVSPILSTLGPSRTSMQFIEDGAVPPPQLPAYVRGIRAILRAHNVPVVIFGHAGDSHIHVNPLVDVTQPHWRETVQSILNEVVNLTAQLGGSLTGEHGDGRLRTPFQPRMWPPEALALFRMVKDAFDPQNLFNPGVKLPLPDQHPLLDIKYDPSLPPLPPRAAQALATVSSKRAYNRFRLALLDQPSPTS